MVMYLKPKSYKEGLKCPEWKSTMQKELGALNANDTWELVTFTTSHVVINYKWFFRVKLLVDGTLEKI